MVVQVASWSVENYKFERIIVKAIKVTYHTWLRVGSRHVETVISFRCDSKVRVSKDELNAVILFNLLLAHQTPLQVFLARNESRSGSNVD